LIFSDTTLDGIIPVIHDFRTMPERSDLLCGGSIGERLCAQLARIGQLREYEAGDVVFRRGDPGDGLILIAEGSAEVSIVNPGGTVSILGVFGPGHVLGEIACLDGKERSADVKALNDLKVYFVPRLDLRNLLSGDAVAARVFIDALCQKVRGSNDLLEMRVEHSATFRLAHVLLKVADDVPRKNKGIRVSQTWLGRYSGLTRERVNRQLGTWSKQGIVRLDSGEIRILDKRRLEGLATGDDMR
jgi:CRP-like cAMP-binding protein